MKKFIQLSVMILSASLLNFGAQAQTVQQVPVQQVTPPARLKAIELAPGTAKNLPALFVVATKTRMFLNLADDLKLTAEQRAKLEEIHRDLQDHVRETKVNYDQKNESLQAILSQDHIELENMRQNLQAAEQLKAEMQYYLFESLVKAANVLTQAQQQQIVNSIPTSSDELK